MQNIVIDEEFKGLLPALDENTYTSLEEDILENGCRDALILWGDVLIDGYNRFEICSKHDLPFQTVSIEFATRESVLIWIITTQVARRNMSPSQLIYYRGRHYRAERKLKGMYDRSLAEMHNSQNGNYGDLTVSKLAGQYKVSKNTIGRDGKASEGVDAIGEVSPEAKRLILADEVRIDKNVLEKITAMAADEIESIALSIENGTYEKKKSETAAPGEDASYGDGASPGNQAPGTHQLDAAIDLITDDYYFAQLRKHTRNDDTAEFKNALRAYISMLEDLYRQL